MIASRVQSDTPDFGQKKREVSQASCQPEEILANDA